MIRESILDPEALDQLGNIKQEFKIPAYFEEEEHIETMKFIESKRNWDVEKQRYRIPVKEAAKIARTTNLSDCKIYWRGAYLILEHNEMIHYWDSFPYCFLKQAVEFMELEKFAKWKTLDKLISLRMGIRQTEVNSCGFVDIILVDKKMTKPRYEEFMRLARAQDYQHHGSHTF